MKVEAPPLGGFSITRRVALLFAVVVLATFLGVGSYLYRSLASQLERRDDTELLGKITLTRHLLADMSTIVELRRAPEALLKAMFGHEGLSFALLAADGETLVANSSMPSPMPALSVVSASRAPTYADVREWETDDSRRRAVGARGVLRSGEEVLIVVARDVSERDVLLRTYGLDLILAALAGSLIASSLGYLTVKSGLHPVAAVAHKANEITTLKLDTRLVFEETPRELRELAAAFNAMLDRLENGMRRLSRFAADLAHDLRTPVNALMVNTQVALSRPRSEEEYRALLESGVEEYERLSRLIESTLFLARAENEQLALRREAVDARRLLEKVADYFGVIAEDSGVRVDVEARGSLFADPMLAERAVSNLVANAVRHADAGGTVRLRAAPGDGDVFVVSVENPGKPVSDTELERVFDRYYRGDPARGGPPGSAGLGLAIVRAIMALHGGSARADSTADTVRFELVFPLPKVSGTSSA